MQALMSNEPSIGVDQFAHQQAQKFAAHHYDRPEHARKVYLNTLSLFAVYDYFYSQVEFDPDLILELNLEQSDSWSLTKQALMDVADLTVTNQQGTPLGRVECRPVLPGEAFMQVPPEVWDDRLLYIAVQLELTPDAHLSSRSGSLDAMRSLQTATILGFVETAATEQISIHELKSPELLWYDLFRQLASRQHSPKPVVLMHWLKGVFEDGWQRVEELLDPPSFQFALRSSPEKPTQSDLSSEGEPSPMVFRQGKLLELCPEQQVFSEFQQHPVSEIEPSDHRLVLLVSLISKQDKETAIEIEIRPPKGQLFLPPDVLVQVLDESSTLVHQENTRANQNFLRFSLSGDSGEKFSVQLMSGNTHIIETFLI